jgi:hypothetical protein
MLLRLHDQYDVRKVGLEGALQSARPLSAQWFRTAGGPAAAKAREDVAVRMLAEGEISSAEFLALILPDVKVFGTETAALYNTEAPTRGNPSMEYLIGIAEKGLSQTDIRKVNDLIRAKRQDEAIEYMLSANPWTREQFQALKAGSGDNSAGTSLEEMRDRAIAVSGQGERGGRDD